MKNPMFAFGQCLRHAFMEGAGYGDDNPKISEEDQKRWVMYDPPETGSFATMNQVIARASREESMILHPNVFGRYTGPQSIEEPRITGIERPVTGPSGVSIVAAAVKMNEIVVSVPRPGRHDDIIKNLAAIFDGPTIWEEAGFLTSAGTFVDRKTAYNLALNIGQIPTSKLMPGKTELYSEDLW